MADIEIATVLANGTISNIHLNGVTTNDKVLTKQEVDSAIDTKITPIDTRVTDIENLFPSDGDFYLPGLDPTMTMFMLTGSTYSTMAIQEEGKAYNLAEMGYSTLLETFYLTLNDKNTGSSLTDFVLLNDGTCQINGDTLATQQWADSKDFYRYFKLVGGRTISQDTYTEVARLDVNDVPSGVIEYGMSMTFNYSTTSRSAQFRFSTDGGTNWSYWNKEIKDTTNDENFYYAYPSENGSVQDVSLIVEAKCEGASDTLNVKFLNIFIDRKSDF